MTGPLYGMRKARMKHTCCIDIDGPQIWMCRHCRLTLSKSRCQDDMATLTSAQGCLAERRRRCLEFHRARAGRKVEKSVGLTARNESKSGNGQIISRCTYSARPRLTKLPSRTSPFVYPPSLSRPSFLDPIPPFSVSVARFEGHKETGNVLNTANSNTTKYGKLQ
jgi:hypothetical protein